MYTYLWFTFSIYSYILILLRLIWLISLILGSVCLLLWYIDEDEDDGDDEEDEKCGFQLTEQKTSHCVPTVHLQEQRIAIAVVLKIFSGKLYSGKEHVCRLFALSLKQRWRSPQNLINEKQNADHFMFPIHW